MTVSRGQIGTLVQVGTGLVAYATWSTNPTAGNTILLFVQTAGTIVSVVDNGSAPRTFTADVSNTSNTGAYIFRANNITLPSSGTYRVTITLTGGSSTIQGGGVEYIGMATGGPTVVHSPTGTGTAVSTGGASPANAGGLVFGGFSDLSGLNPETVTFGGSAPQVEQFRNTNGSSYWPMAVADALTGGSQTFAWTLGDSVSWSAAIASYEAAGTGGGGGGGGSSVNPSWDPTGNWALTFDDEFTSTTLRSEWQPGWFGASGVTPPVNSNSPNNNSANVTLPGDDTLHLDLTTTQGALVTTNPNNSGTAIGFTQTKPAAFEARIFVPGSGSTVSGWPAWWLDGQNWPGDGEIDIMEGLSGVTAAHIHDNFTDGPGGAGAPGITHNTGSGFHTFGCYWKSTNSVEFFYDGASIGSLATDGFTGPLYLILVNTFPTNTGITASTMKVDWVRVWVPSTGGGVGGGGGTSGGSTAGTSPNVTTTGASVPNIFVEAGVTPTNPVIPAGTFILDNVTSGILDTDALASSIIWSDISNDVISFTVNRSSTREQGPLWQFQPGTISILLDNSNSSYDPDNLAGPYVVGGVTQLVAMVPVRLRATLGQLKYDLYNGFADGWFPAEVTYQGEYAEITLAATDAFKVLSNINLAQLGSPTGVGADTGTRIKDILNRAGWYTSADKQSIDVGNTVLQGTTLGADALSLMQIAVDTEIGQLYVNGAGAVVFNARRSLLTDTKSNTVQAVFGDKPDTVHPAGVELTCASITRANDDTTIVNDVQATRAGGSALQEVKDTASIAKFLFPRTYPRTDLILQSDSDTLNWAQWVLYIGKASEDRIESIKVNPMVDPLNLWPQVLGREIGDRIQVWVRPPLATSPITKDCFIVGIQHDWNSADNTWLTTWTLQDASKYGSFFTLNNATLGKLNFNALTF
jgi:hypothetical protein